jgi:hypothetical protein
VLPIWLPGMGMIRGGALLVDDHASRGRRTWEEFLARRLS